eukprot:TRINITY_DN43911_c0_g1_i1.p1 TRINITY_DN43911_c0_g1~~TRINITY_DN43911_c0_g1_i1.p1  ORF type:complete len:448 (-),score=61.24 TRINITY_DN43911_c0_g1_i1:70-1332(-)
MARCSECGTTSKMKTFDGSEACVNCGSERSSGQLRGALSEEDHAIYAASAAARESGVYASRLATHGLTSTTAPGSHWRFHTSRQRQVLRAETVLRHRRTAIDFMADIVGLQEVVREHAVLLMEKHCTRKKRTPRRPLHLRCLAGACLYLVSVRDGAGLTLEEMAARAECPSFQELSKATWNVCKVNGIRVVRTGVHCEALVHRLSVVGKLNINREVVSAVACRLVEIADWGWISVGRHWTYVVVAAFILACKLYVVDVDVDAIALKLGISLAAVFKRESEMKKLVISLLRPLPWGRVVSMRNVYGFLLFAVEFAEVLKAALPELHSAQAARQTMLARTAASSKRTRAPVAQPTVVRETFEAAKSAERGAALHSKAAAAAAASALTVASVSADSEESGSPPARKRHRAIISSPTNSHSTLS